VAVQTTRKPSRAAMRGALPARGERAAEEPRGDWRLVHNVRDDNSADFSGFDRSERLRNSRGLRQTSVEPRDVFVSDSRRRGFAAC
jgi:hypothetical protein